MFLLVLLDQLFDVPVHSSGCSFCLSLPFAQFQGVTRDTSWCCPFAWLDYGCLLLWKVNFLLFCCTITLYGRKKIHRILRFQTSTSSRLPFQHFVRDPSDGEPQNRSQVRITISLFKLQFHSILQFHLMINIK